MAAAWRHVRRVPERPPPRASELLPASRLTFQGIRSIYRRDGFGAELVVATGAGDEDRAASAHAYSETPYRPVTAILAFPGSTLEQVLRAREVTLVGYDPYRHDGLQIQGTSVPLAANFTSAYGLWLARSGFSVQALRTVLGRSRSLDAPHVYLMQPFDPNRRVIIMLHGLASSPEAWINVANDIMGDEALRQRYQVWQVYYPTNAPLAYNHAAIRSALTATFQHFDPSGATAASRDIVVVGHSMGGVLGRLLVSSSGSVLLDTVKAGRQLEGERFERFRTAVEGFELRAIPGRDARDLHCGAPQRDPIRGQPALAVPLRTHHVAGTSGQSGGTTAAGHR